MTRLAWGAAGSRKYQTGLDRGVLYLPNGLAVPWNGLTSVTDDAGSPTIEEYYLDGVKYLSRRTPTDYGGTLKAITYPDEFQQFDGIGLYDTGIYVADQLVPQTFGLCYRTLLGDDINGLSAGYVLHVLYNLTAKPDSRSYASLGSTASPEEFGWTLSGVPVYVQGMRPSVHFMFKSNELAPGVMSLYEDTLYGTATTAPALPTAQTLVDIQQNSM